MVVATAAVVAVAAIEIVALESPTYSMKSSPGNPQELQKDPPDISEEDTLGFAGQEPLYELTECEEDATNSAPCTNETGHGSYNKSASGTTHTALRRDHRRLSTLRGDLNTQCKNKNSSDSDAHLRSHKATLRKCKNDALRRFER
ncbi:unnamed protein product, partial [Notodromas monacha]